MKTAPRKKSSPSPEKAGQEGARTRRSNALAAAQASRGPWSKKPVSGLFNDGGAINVNVMLDLLFEFLKDYDSSKVMKD